MKRATRNAARAKKEIIEKSAPVFNTYGFAGTKIQMLVDATGYQAGGIYRHFNNKKDLAKAVFQHNYEVMIKRNFLLDESLNPKDKLLTIFNNYKEAAIRPPIAGGCPILNTAIEVDDTDEEFRQLTQSYVSDVINMIADIIEEGKHADFFLATIVSKQEAQYLFASIEGAIMLGRITNDRNTFVNIYDRAVTSFLEKIMK